MITNKYARLSTRLEDFAYENKQLKADIMDFERVKKAFGIAQVNSAIKMVKEHEKKQEVTRHKHTQKIQ